LAFAEQPENNAFDAIRYCATVHQSGSPGTKDRIGSSEICLLKAASYGSITRTLRPSSLNDESHSVKNR
jgi:hypothetical protein